MLESPPSRPGAPGPSLPLPDGAPARADTATGLQMLTEIACTINSVLDLEQLYRVIYEQCARVFAVDDFWIGRAGPGDGPLQVVLHRETRRSPAAPQGGRGQGPGLYAEVLAARRTLRVDDYAAACRDRGLPPISLPPGGPRGWLGVPMMVGDRLIGLIVGSRVTPFSAEDARLLEAIASLCAVAIENAGLVQLVSETAQDLMRSMQELSDLNRFASTVNRSLDLPTVLAEGADVLLRVTGWDTATVCLHAPGDRWAVALQRRAAESRPPAAPTAADIAPPLAALIAEVVAAGRPVAVDLPAAAARTATLQQQLGRGLRRLVLFPLRAGRPGAVEAPPILGVLVLGSRRASRGVAVAEMLRDTTLLAIGEQLAGAVQNARLLDEVQTARGHLAALLDSTADGVIFYATDLRVELANRAIHAQYGLEPGALVGLTPEEVSDRVRDCFADHDQPEAIVAHLRTAPSDVTYAQECVLQHPTRRVLQRLLQPVRDTSGTVLGRMIVYHDVTQAKELERRTAELAALEERQYLARELHDSVTQSLFTVTLMAEAAQAMAERDPARVGAYLDRLKATAGSALDEMRALLAQLRPPVVGADGLGAALRRHAETVAAQTGLAVLVEADPAGPDLPGPVAEALMRIAQEALHNTVKHAAAREARVVLDVEPGAGRRPPRRDRRRSRLRRLAARQPGRRPRPGPRYHARARRGPRRPPRRRERARPGQPRRRDGAPRAPRLTRPAGPPPRLACRQPGCASKTSVGAGSARRSPRTAWPKGSPDRREERTLPRQDLATPPPIRVFARAAGAFGYSCRFGPPTIAAPHRPNRARPSPRRGLRGCCPQL